MKKLKTGVIGIGFIGAAHVEALRRIPGIEVAAIAHSSDAKAKVIDLNQAWRILHPQLLDPVS